MAFDLAFLSRRATISVLDQVAASATSFATGVIVSRGASKETFGLYVLATSIVVLVNSFQSGTLAYSFAVRSQRLQGDELAEYTGSAFVHQVMLSVIVALILLCALPVHALGWGIRGLPSIIVPLAMMITFILLREFVRVICFARMHMAAALRLDVTVAVFQVGSVLALRHFDALSAGVVIIVIGLSALLGIGGWLLSANAPLRFLPRRVVPDFLSAWSFGRWALPSAVLWTFGMSLCPWLLATFHGARSAAIWGACMGILGLANPVLGGFQNYLGPRLAIVLAEEGVAALQQAAKRLAVRIVAGTMTFWLAIFFVGERVVTLVYGNQYQGVGPVITALGLSMAATSIIFLYSRVLFAMDRADADFRVNLLTTTVLLAVGIPATYSWGPVGAAVGLMTANIVAAGAQWTTANFILRAALHHASAVAPPMPASRIPA